MRQGIAIALLGLICAAGGAATRVAGDAAGDPAGERAFVEIEHSRDDASDHEARGAEAGRR